MTEPQKKPPIYVTQPLLPPLEEFIPYLQKIWDSKWLTNNGPFHHAAGTGIVRLPGCQACGTVHERHRGTGYRSASLAHHRRSDHDALLVRGDRAFACCGTVSSRYLWTSIRITLNLDPDKIEAAITPQTTAIMPVHCYGHPCDVDRIEKIADNYGLKVIYDAAHAFGVQCHDGSVLNHGDLSVLSFHATKVFNTFEGGAIVCHDAKTKQRIDHLKNFGFVDEVTVVAPGINGKMSEINAAFGLLQLKGIDEALQKRKAIDARYREGVGRGQGYSLPVGCRRKGSQLRLLPDSGATRVSAQS